jgi:hypothetical protein
MNDVKKLIRGGYDLHVHSAPDVLPRKMDDLDMGERCTHGPLAGYVIKNHWTATGDRAKLIHKLYPACDAIGSITLNSAVGGINAPAVEMAARNGCKMVWFPTCDNEHEMAYQFNGDPNKKPAFWASIVVEMKNEGIKTPTINILDDKGALKLEVYDVLDVIRRYDMILATGHISHEEAYKLVPAAAERGVKHIIITHVTFPTTTYSIEDQKMFVKYGAKMEQCYTTWKTGKCDFDTIAAEIREIGPKNCFLATDLGNTKLCYPDEGLEEFAEKLLEKGFTEDEIRTLVVRNPRELLGKEQID